jgi:DNA-damage-inducible protein D
MISAKILSYNPYPMTPQSIALFEQKEIRKISHNDEWYFSIIDIISVLTGSENPRRYWSDLKTKLSEEGIQTELYEKIVQLKLTASDGKKYATDCANTETLLRIIQSIPSPKAEPFKRWLAQVGYERIQEIEDPEIAMKRMTDTYEAKGYSKEWIDKRMRGIAVRKDLTDEWDDRGIETRQYGILTAEISRATFGMTPSEYREYKWLTKKSDNLRDHMTDLEIIFTMLGEASTTEIMKQKDSKGFREVEKASKEWGTVAGNARKELEEKTQQKVISKENYLPEKRKTLKSQK